MKLNRHLQRLLLPSLGLLMWSGLSHLTAQAPTRQAYARPELLTETQWLADNLHKPGLRIVETTCTLTPGEGGRMTAHSGREAWEKARIPGSVYIDLIKELSDPASDLPFTMPQPRQFAEVMSRHGISNKTRVVIYDRGNTTWAARLWWMLRTAGFEQASILNGGWQKWMAEQRPVAHEPFQAPSPTSFIFSPTPRVWVDKDDVLSSLDKKDVIRVCALGKGAFDKSHIPGSVNVPAAGLLDKDGTLLPQDRLEQLFVNAGVKKGAPIIVYCGGGISACGDAFALTLLGYDRVSVYDGSMDEWGGDPKLPKESTK